jgi:hypothetical protein
MGHTVCIQSDEQFIAALGVLDELPGMWHCRGPAESPILLLLDSHYDALVKAGVVAPNGKEGKSRGKKTVAKQNKS